VCQRCRRTGCAVRHDRAVALVPLSPFVDDLPSWSLLKTSVVKEPFSPYLCVAVSMM
jgi:hypothetical protein